MASKIIQENKKRLEQEKAMMELRIKLLSSNEESDAKEGTRPAWVDYGQKSDENAAEVAEYADKVSLSGSLQKRLEEIGKALDAIEKGTYGVCKECGEEIEEARLRVMPTAIRCLSCKRKHT